MAGLMDRIKGMFGGAKDQAADAGEGGGGAMDKLKDTAGDVKDKVDDLVEKAGDKVPDAVKETYDKVSDKVEDIIPGDKDDDGH